MLSYREGQNAFDLSSGVAPGADLVIGQARESSCFHLECSFVPWMESEELSRGEWSAGGGLYDRCDVVVVIGRKAAIAAVPWVLVPRLID